MNILAVDTSSLVASVAVLNDSKLICEYTQNTKITHSQTLMPMVDEVLKRAELDISEIDLFASAIGPGSFTGLRIGIATAKGFAQALDKGIIGVSTLEAIAFNLPFCKYTVCPIMDARRNQVYNALYDTSYGKCKTITEPRAVSLEALIDEIKEKGEKVVFCGDGTRVYAEEIIKQIPDLALFAPLNNLEQRAASVGMLAQIKYSENKKAESYFDLKPVYLRKCQAERELEEKEKNKGDN